MKGKPPATITLLWAESILSKPTDRIGRVLLAMALRCFTIPARASNLISPSIADGIGGQIRSSERASVAGELVSKCCGSTAYDGAVVKCLATMERPILLDSFDL